MNTALISQIRAVQEEKNEKSINTTNMIKKKLAYEAPKTESLELSFEGLVCQSPTGENVNSQTIWSGNGGWS